MIAEYSDEAPDSQPPSGGKTFGTSSAPIWEKGAKGVVSGNILSFGEGWQRCAAEGGLPLT